MGDTTSLAAWTPTFESWRAEALPKIQEGKTTEAFGSYPWFQGIGVISGSVQLASAGWSRTPGCPAHRRRVDRP
jgi:hypothetical protein